MLRLRATANHVIALQYLCMCLMSQMFLFYFIFYGGALVLLGGAGASASLSLAPPMNEEMASQYHHLHLRDTDTENTSLLVNISNISLLFPPDTFMVITFAWALRQALLRVFEAELFSCADSSLLLLDSKHRRAALDSRDTVSCCFHQRGNFFHH